MKGKGSEMVVSIEGKLFLVLVETESQLLLSPTAGTKKVKFLLSKAALFREESDSMFLKHNRFRLNRNHNIDEINRFKKAFRLKIVEGKEGLRNDYIN